MAGRARIKSYRIFRCGNFLYSEQTLVYILYDFVDTYNHNNLFRPEGDRGNAVGVAVHIYKLPLFGEGICGAEEKVTAYSRFKSFKSFFITNSRFCAVTEIVFGRIYNIPNAAFLKGHRTARSYHRTVGEHIFYNFTNLCLGFGINRINIVAFKTY